MHATDYFLIIIAISPIIKGIMQLATGKLYANGGNFAKYTDESVTKYAKANGAVLLVFGLIIAAMCALVFTGNNGLFLWILFAVAVVFIIIATILCRKLILKEN
ncbi:MAG: hypothetical protein KBS62_01015 [Oscillospiraceae bacterium]|nr:hypothetical protein [Candidatus Ruminococcus equi]